MPAEAVIQKGQPIRILIRCKGYVAGLRLEYYNSGKKYGVALICVDTNKNA